MVVSPPNSTLTNISTTMESNIIPLRGKLERCVGVALYETLTIPAGTYKKDEDCSTVTQWGLLQLIGSTR